MSIWKETGQYLKGGYFNDYCEGKSIVYSVAFTALTLFRLFIMTLAVIVLLPTSPLWIIPYMIYLRVKRGGENERFR